MNTLDIRTLRRMVFAALLAGGAGPALAQSGSSPTFNAAQQGFASLSADEQAAFKRWLATQPLKRARGVTRTEPAGRSVRSSEQRGPQAVQPEERLLDRVPILSKRVEAIDNVHKGCTGFVPLLRKDWADIGYATCPQSVAKAKGAEISYSNDRVKGNAIWSVNGTAALLYNSGSSIGETSTGAYVTVNRVANSSLAESDANANSVAYGGVLELGGLPSIENDAFYLANYFRVRGGAVQDLIKKTDAASVTFEWLPVVSIGGFHLHDGFQPFGSALPVIVRIDPSLLVQYARLVGGTKPLAFNDMNEALRVGPQVRLGIYGGTSDFFSHFSGSVTYHWAYETYSGRQLSLFDSSLTYNIDKDGHFGITASYQRGHNENTGTLADIYKLSLTGKI